VERLLQQRLRDADEGRADVGELAALVQQAGQFVDVRIGVGIRGAAGTEDDEDVVGRAVDPQFGLHRGRPRLEEFDDGRVDAKVFPVVNCHIVLGPGLADDERDVGLHVTRREQRQRQHGDVRDGGRERVDGAADRRLGELEEAGVDRQAEAPLQVFGERPDLFVGLLAARAVAGEDDRLGVEHQYASACSTLFRSFRRRLGANSPEFSLPS
jgi:hypothetical protein